MLSKRYRTALVTGGAQGIGRAITAALIADGVAVAIVDLDGVAAAATAQEMARGGRCCAAVTADVTDAAQMQQACARAEELLGAPVDILVNNAGIVVGGHFADTTVADTVSQVEVNLLAPMRLIHLLLPGMLARRYGHIVNVASVGGLQSNPGISVYCATKFGVVGFSEALRSELAGTGVEVSVICPGLIRTGIAEHGEMRGLPRSRVEAMMKLGASPARVGRATVGAIRRNRAVTVVTVHGRLVAWWYRHFPRSYRRLMAVAGRQQRKEIAAARVTVDIGPAAGFDSPVVDQRKGGTIMASAYEAFWTQSSFAFVGHSAAKGFPRLSYSEAKKHGKKVFAVDPSVADIDGDKTYPDLRALPEKVDGVVIEVPRAETFDVVQQAADVGIKNVWVHMNRDTPEAVELARQKGLNLLTGTCAVMYMTGGFSAHGIHKWVNKLLGKY